MDVVILWKRGTKKIDTAVKPISPENTMAVLNEKFQMKTQLEWDGLRQQFRQKRSLLSLHHVRQGEKIMETASDGSTVVLGHADLDLAKYANNPQMLQDKLMLKNSEDESAYIEIAIKTNA